MDRVEPPKRTRGDDDDPSAFLSTYHHDLEKASEILKDGKSVFSGTGMPDMQDGAWLAIKIPAGTSKSETLTDAQSVEPLQKDVDKLLISVSFSLDEETIQQICSNPELETAFNVMVRRRRAEVKVSTLSAEQKRELVKAKDKELSTFVKYSVVEAASRQGISPSALMKMRWVVTFKDDGSLKARLVVQGLQTKDSARFQRLLQAHLIYLVRFSDTCRIIWFPNSQRRRKMCISSGRLGRATCGRR